MDDVFIVGATRTPIGSYLGSLASVSAVELGAVAIRAALSQAEVDASAVEEVFMGNVLSAGIGQAPARQAALRAGLPDTVPCTTVNKVCGSGLQAVVLGTRAILLGDASVIVCGGMESMSNVPYYLQKARTGYRMGHDKLIDGMLLDGLWDPYNDFHMGQAAELCAAEYQLSRASQDEYAARSYERARAAHSSGAFAAELVPVEVPTRKGPPTVVDSDEEPTRGEPERFGTLRPAFRSDGTVTAANASSLNDGAAALVLASGAIANERKLTVLARVAGYASAAGAPEWFTTAPARAIEAVLTKVGMTVDDIDLFEINEAFACVVQACTELTGVPMEKVNVHGGAVALGHPIGASGARVLTTLVHAMRSRGAKRGLATLCIGGGEAVAVIVEAP